MSTSAIAPLFASAAGYPVVAGGAKPRLAIQRLLSLAVIASWTKSSAAIHLAPSFSVIASRAQPGVAIQLAQ